MNWLRKLWALLTEGGCGGDCRQGRDACTCDIHTWATKQGCKVCSPEYREQKED